MGILRLSLEKMGILCEIRGLSVSYVGPHGARVRAVDELSLSIGAGEVVGILGESGCGKSTLAAAILRMLPGSAACQSGSVLFRKRDLLAMTEAELREVRGVQIALVPQDPVLNLNPVINAGTQIAEVLRAHFAMSSKERRARVLALLGEVGFERPAEIYLAYPHQLSGGQRQRVAIALAISCRPALLIGDEPTSKLDASLQAEIVSLLARVRRQHGIATVLISHDPAIFAGFADRIAVMYAGRIVEVGTVAQIFREPLHPYTRELVGIARSIVLPTVQATTLPRFAAIDGESPDPANLPAGCRFHPRCADRMDVCSQRYPQVFVPEPSRPVNCFKYGE